jgi:long-subunit acyl-CoA synthetase (AMP-forming)
MAAPPPFTTLCEAFQHTARASPDAVALRTMGGRQTVTWREYAERVRRIAGGLDALGIRRGDAIALLLTNRPEFNLVDAAAMHLGAAPFSVYNTFSPEQINYLLTNSGCRVPVCERQYLEQARAAGGPVEHIVVVDDPAREPTPGTVSLCDLEATRAEGFDFDATWRGVVGSDVLTLIYTSGTTGDPKGVELTHANVLAEIGMFDSELGLRRGDRYISYLPAAHVADRVSAHYLHMVHGTEVTTVSDGRRIAEALAEVRPDFFFAVPRVWEKLKSALDSLLMAGGPEAEAFARAMELALKRVRARRNGLGPDPVEEAEFGALDQAVLGPVRERLGLDRMRWAMSGAAAIAPEVLEFFMALGVTIVEAWGMSETTGVASVNPLGRVKVGTVGVTFPGVEMRIEQDGEASVRGPIVMRGYRNDPDRTAEAFTADGWLRTGDVVRVDDEGYLTIVDRKKELIINSAGKNMSPSNIENTMNAYCPLIGTAVAIGDARPYNTALFVLDPDMAASFAATTEAAASPATLARHPAVVRAIRQGVGEANRTLSRVEQIKRFHVLPTFWEPGGDEITPTLKLKRTSIIQKYAAEVELLYAEAPGPDVHEPERDFLSAPVRL